ncbi:MAG: hypothetical protein ACJ786_05935 [Catenulispora sp.]
MPDPTPPPAEPTKEQLKGALKAFKKRLKLTRLDAESQLSKNPLSTGRGHGIVAISPPIGYPEAVWDELVRQKKLKKAGQGLYELVPE